MLNWRFGEDGAENAIYVAVICESVGDLIFRRAGPDMSALVSSIGHCEKLDKSSG